MLYIVRWQVKNVTPAVIISQSVKPVEAGKKRDVSPLIYTIRYLMSPFWITLFSCWYTESAS